MKILKMKTINQNYLFLYLITISLALVMRSCCRITDSDMLTWILAPTARWAGILGGIPFEYLPHQGYVNHFYRFLIASSCSGIRFMTITFLMLVFSFLHQIKSAKAGCFWFVSSAVFSYLATIFVNGVRIVLAVYLPIPLEKAGLLNGWLNPDRLHTMIGTATYFSSLCIIYPAASFLCQNKFMKIPPCVPAHAKTASHKSGYGLKLLVPVFWYLSAVLVFPLLRRLIQNNWEGFGTYAALITGICALIITPIILICLFRHPKKICKI